PRTQLVGTPHTRSTDVGRQVRVDGRDRVGRQQESAHVRVLSSVWPPGSNGRAATASTRHDSHTHSSSLPWNKGRGTVRPMSDRSLPTGLVPARRTPSFDPVSLPPALVRSHRSVLG